MTFTKRKFLNLDPLSRHKKCAEELRALYPGSYSSPDYLSFLSWMKLNLPPLSSPEHLADRYHWHLAQAALSLKEHNLLPHLRTGDRPSSTPFLPIAIYLDKLRSAYNVGSILRTMEALRIGSLHFSPASPFISNEKVQKTAMGTHAIVPCFASTPLSTLPRPLIALDTSSFAIPLRDFTFPPSFTLILGNEEYGVSAETLSQVDHLVEIPLFGQKNSLNVAAAFAIAASEIDRQLRS